MMPTGTGRNGIGCGFVAACLALLAGAGCESLTSINNRLNGAGVSLEHRLTNSTRATTAVAAEASQADQETSPRAPTAVATVRSPASSTDAPDVRPDGVFVGLALSGGGSRSANFSAACMFQLERLGLLQDVDYISSVSGGSLTAAYYCVARNMYWSPGVVQYRLTRSFATDVIVQSVLPWNTLTLWFTDWDRSDLLADSFNRVLFSRFGTPLTFGDLRRDRPRLLINATDLQSGRRFVFSHETFDQLNSDLSSYPLGNAVAASSAVPVLLHHVTLRDFSTKFKQYRHLIDGGVSDNLGVQTLVDTYGAQIEAAAREGRPDPYPRGAVLIVLDARTEFDARLSNKGDISFFESVIAGADLTSTALLNRASSATLSDIVLRNAPDDATAGELRRQIAYFQKTGSLTLRDRNGRPVRVIHLSLSRVADLSRLPFASFRERVNSISTYFNIDPTEAYHLYQAADLLVRERFEPELVQLESDIREGRPLSPGPRPATGPAPATAPSPDAGGQ
jgi:predicted acylesterase/phospholipase RssA